MKNSLSVRVCTADEYAATLLVELAHGGQSLPLLQSPYYGAWQARDGKTVVYFLALQGDRTVAAGLAIKFDAPGGLSFFYCPYGPVALEWTPELLAALREFFKPIAKRMGAMFVRLDSAGLTDLPGVKPVTNHLAVTASLQPRVEWLLDISGKQDDIWMGLHKHARYNVRLAERAGAELKLYEPAKAPLDTFFELMQTTAGRDSFSLQSRQYYEAAFRSIPPEAGFLAVCTIDGKPAAASLFAAYDNEIHYVFSGSSNDFRKIAPPYFVLWSAILEAKKRGWHTLNFGGIQDSVKSKHLIGVTGFKKRFGGYEVNHANPVDLVYKPFKYSLFGLYKRLRG
ncbi:MAG TPA: peptidoglycan bridge formation glycyltransferase FemA/FemB family protein [Candidatus Saccharimonadales bacterium]|nr:peptidoglycan bridge formation glycyltransferase FemA/FemB family protein [Candidatus Saccharimonadales bacterium]